MRLYAFTDLHGNGRALKKLQKNVKKDKPDVIACCGDLSVFETELKAFTFRRFMPR